MKKIIKRIFFLIILLVILVPTLFYAKRNLMAYRFFGYQETSVVHVRFYSILEKSNDDKTMDCKLTKKEDVQVILSGAKKAFVDLFPTLCAPDIEIIHEVEGKERGSYAWSCDEKEVALYRKLCGLPEKNSFSVKKLLKEGI